MKLVFAIIFLFLMIMGTVVTVAYRRPSGSTGIDPAQIAQLRQ